MNSGEWTADKGEVAWVVRRRLLSRPNMSLGVTLEATRKVVFNNKKHDGPRTYFKICVANCKSRAVLCARRSSTKVIPPSAPDHSLRQTGQRPIEDNIAAASSIASYEDGVKIQQFQRARRNGFPQEVRVVIAFSSKQLKSHVQVANELSDNRNGIGINRKWRELASSAYFSGLIYSMT